jgi:histidyl-tRNA synthetase
MAEKISLPRGTYDILPNESYKWQYLEKVFRDVAKIFNYKQITTPIFESESVFERSVGDSSDIIQKELYRFLDRKGRKYALRPEGTAPVVRSYVENNLAASAGVTKLFYLGPMFRYDRPQKGRYRQFYQYGIENIGSDNPFFDAEVIALGYTFLRRLGLTNFILEINSIGCSQCSQEYDRALVNYFSPYLDRMCPDCRERMINNPKRLLDCKVPTCKEIAKDAPLILDYLDEDCQDHFEQVQRYLKQMKIPYQINPKIVRGLDYYNKTAFEFLSPNLGAQNALIGGGRYNGLVQQFGGNDLAGIGFAGGMERLMLALETENLSLGALPATDVYIVAIGEKAEAEAVKYLSILRMEGFIAEFDPDKKTLKAQMKAADREKAYYAIIIGEEELAADYVVCKEMASGRQEKIQRNDLREYLENKINGR